MIPNTQLNKLKQLAKSKGLNLIQLYYAWAASKHSEMLLVTGTASIKHLQELIDAIQIQLSIKDIKNIDDYLKNINIYQKTF